MYKLTLFFLLITGSVLGQTRINLQQQSRQVDFTAAQFTKPVRLAATLPSTCQLGEMVLVTPANGLFFCGSAGDWLPVGSGASGVAPDFAVTFDSGTRLRIGSQCVFASPCRARIGATVVVFNAGGAEVTISAGSGLAYIYFNAAGQLTVGHDGGLTLACTNCAVDNNVIGFPADSLPLYTWDASNGAWTPDGTDYRATLGRSNVRTGAGLVATSLTYTSIAAGACAAPQTITITCARLGDAAAPAWPELPAGIQGSAWVSAADTVSIRLCNWSAAAIATGEATYGVTVIRSL
jgi:hypothetical protein